MNLCKSGKHDKDVVGTLERGRCKGCKLDSDRVSQKERRHAQAEADRVNGVIKLCRKGIHDINKQEPLRAPNGSFRCRQCKSEADAASRRRHAEAGYNGPLAKARAHVRIELVPDQDYEFPDVWTAWINAKWMDRGICTDLHDDTFYPDAKDNPGLVTKQIKAAKRICEQCPVRAQCRQWGIDHDEPEGIWGGLTVGDRAKLKLGQLAVAS
jgi:WhiB family redox-sensing transcriptional regulator